jgi:3-methylcrotonyl-CoA carboxylase alpha subunit
MLERLLIANRGEIACRIIKTARAMGIHTIAVYSDADRNARHVHMADEAWHIGPAPSKESYLRSDKVLEIAIASGADAVHPGYGFLSENADFARACEANNLVFVGPPPAAIEAMGSKSAAKSLMEQAGVPLVPGYHGQDQSPALLLEAARRIGFPVLLKAAAGGGGKGMRVVRNETEFQEALEGCQREAAASFGDATVLVEKFLEKPRHVEVQIFADKHGNTVHLFERDCSLQRRHQKVIEEAPAPRLSQEARERLGAIAIKAAKAIGYVGAGTVEFLYDTDGSAFFMEMNTRLQVEHPVTELITGLDLVEWQLRVASGEPLPLGQEEIRCSGHAFEARLYAEDADRGFLPATGQLHHLKFPREDRHTRIDTGVIEGDEIGIHYDPMIAKIIVWDETRERALKRLQKALEATEIAGLTTNRTFLLNLARHPAFAQEELSTDFIEAHQEELLPGPTPVRMEVVALLAWHLVNRDSNDSPLAADEDPWSPWNLRTGWRLNKDNQHHFRFLLCEKDTATEESFTVHFRGKALEISWRDETFTFAGAKEAEETIHGYLDDRRIRGDVVQDDQKVYVYYAGSQWTVEIPDPLKTLEDNEEDARLVAPMPGTVIAVKVGRGDLVKTGDVLMVVEAMKMEHSILAPYDGVVSDIFFAPGDQVQDGQELMKVEAEGTEDGA